MCLFFDAAKRPGFDVKPVLIRAEHLMGSTQALRTQTQVSKSQQNDGGAL